ncbi:hypothetical protein TRFO_30045 [Tritrichomonas foetus]|uniref:Uncharacterized protein n=1 Tax=Tritrichomonas foetus TaxID=1144522 RepID=A0A1J4JUC3_9EUKA|nr:hypothetical protein TRFO_30045 [Tritrichomonas foetus]|eukprot:OHT02737.1 hypothetical protein TRFO_30045 [Tritrichomonas foetus]
MDFIRQLATRDENNDILIPDAHIGNYIFLSISSDLEQPTFKFIKKSENICHVFNQHNLELPLETDLSEDDYNILITPLLEGKSFVVNHSNFILLQMLSDVLKDEDLMKIYHFMDNYFHQIQKIKFLAKIESKILKMDLSVFKQTSFDDELDLTEIVTSILLNVVSSRPHQIPDYAKYVKKLCDFHEKLRDQINILFFDLDKIKKLRQKQKDNYYLYRCFYDEGIFDEDKLLEFIDSHDSVFGFAWFIDIIDAEMFNEMIDLIKENYSSLYSCYINQIEEMRSNNFEKFNEIKKIGEILSPTAEAIRNDDVNEFSKYVNHDSDNFHDNSLEPSILQIHPNFYEHAPSLFSYSLFFGSYKCVKYMISNCTIKNIGKYFIDALYSNNAEILHILDQKQAQLGFWENYPILLHLSDVYNWMFDRNGNGCFLLNSHYNSISSFNFIDFFKSFIRTNCYDDLKRCLKCALTCGNNEIAKLFNLIIGTSLLPNWIPTFDARNNETQQSNYSKQFFQACIRGNLKKVKYLMNKFDYVTFINGTKNGFLRNFVCENNRISILKLLLKNDKIDVNKEAVGIKGNSFTLAAWTNKIALVNILYKTGKIDVNYIGGRGETPLTGCSVCNYPLMAQVLLSFPEIEVNKPNESHQNAIEIAINNKSSNVILALLQSPKLIFSSQEILKYAVENKNPEIIAALMKHPNTKFNELIEDHFEKYFQEKIEEKMDVTIEIIEYAKAFKNFDQEYLKKIIIKFNNIYIYNGVYQTKDEVPDLMDCLLFHDAIRKSHFPTVEYLLFNTNCDPNRKDENGVTPIIYSIQLNEVQIALLLASSEKVDLRVTDESGNDIKSILIKKQNSPDFNNSDPANLKLKEIFGIE